MKRNTFLFLTSFFILGVLFLLKGQHNCTYALAYGPEAKCPADSSKTVGSYYPGQTISSVDLHVGIIGNNVPAGKQVAIAAGAPVVCSAVACLKRSDGAQATIPTSGNISVPIQTIGCSSGECDDTLTVSVSNINSITEASCSWSYSFTGAPSSFVPGSQTTINITNSNGTEKYVYFMINCAQQNPPTKTPTLTPTKTPTLTPTKSPTPTVTIPVPTTPPTIPVNTLTPTTPVNTSTPTVTGPICPAPGTPVVTVNCPACAN